AFEKQIGKMTIEEMEVYMTGQVFEQTFAEVEKELQNDPEWLKKSAELICPQMSEQDRAADPLCAKYLPSTSTGP
ncbi:MAG: hypothetical protein ACAI44_02955, partial [Candidatus Sericytochromatia bacterium]